MVGPVACGGSSTPTDALHPGHGGAGARTGGGGAAAAGTAGMTGTAGGVGTAGMVGTTTAPPCSDVLAQGLQAFSIDISAANWAAIQNEFLTVGNLSDHEFVQHTPATYPIVFHHGGETVGDATIHLKGDSSWQEAAQFDGANGKMQFSISFDDVDASATFHGLSKIKFDMPRTDPTFMRDRIANTWLRSIDIPAPCATSARLTINGADYGVFVAEENVGHHVVKDFFGPNAAGDLWDGGEIAQTNKSNPNTRGATPSGTRRRLRR
jgi:hypothetical protein